MVVEWTGYAQNATQLTDDDKEKYLALVTEAVDIAADDWITNRIKWGRLQDLSDIHPLTVDQQNRLHVLERRKQLDDNILEYLKIDFLKLGGTREEFADMTSFTQ